MTRAINRELIAANLATAAVYQTEIHALLDDLRALIPDLELLTDTHQIGAGFSTPESRAAIDRMIVAERTARRAQPIRRDGDGNTIVGLKWLNASEDSYVTGEHATPGNFRGMATLADIAFTVTSHVHRIRRIVLASGHPDPEPDLVDTTVRTAVRPANRPPGFIGPMPKVTTIVAAADRPDVPALLTRLGRLVDAAPSPTLLDPIQRDLEDLVDQVSRVVDGPDRSHRPDPCPHCGHRSLIRYEATRRRPQPFIRCERDPRWTSKHFRACVCASAICQCKTDPVGFRHEWFDNPKDKTQRNVWELIDRIKLIKENAMLETQAQDAIGRVRDLHTRVEIQPWADQCPGEHWDPDEDEAADRGVEPVLILHQYVETEAGDVCVTCAPAVIACTHCSSLNDTAYVPWPCATVTALDPTS